MAQVIGGGIATFSAIITMVTVYTVPAGQNLYLSYLFVGESIPALASGGEVAILIGTSGSNTNIGTGTVNQQSLGPITFTPPLIIPGGESIIIERLPAASATLYYGYAGNLV